MTTITESETTEATKIFHRVRAAIMEKNGIRIKVPAGATVYTWTGDQPLAGGSVIVTFKPELPSEAEQQRVYAAGYGFVTHLFAATTPDNLEPIA